MKSAKNTYFDFKLKPSQERAFSLQNPEGLTTFGRSDDFYYIYLYIKVLTPSNISQ